MRRVRIMASRQAWLRRRETDGMQRYQRIVAYECMRNGTASYTPYWAA